MEKTVLVLHSRRKDRDHLVDCRSTRGTHSSRLHRLGRGWHSAVQSKQGAMAIQAQFFDLLWSKVGIDVEVAFFFVLLLVTGYFGFRKSPSCHSVFARWEGT
jgi:hypothetical protein